VPHVFVLVNFKPSLVDEAVASSPGFAGARLVDEAVASSPGFAGARLVNYKQFLVRCPSFYISRFLTALACTQRAKPFFDMPKLFICLDF